MALIPAHPTLPTATFSGTLPTVTEAAPTSASVAGCAACQDGALMNTHATNRVALVIKHKTKPGKRDQVREVWQRHMQPLVVSNAAHEAYFYCFDDADPDGIVAFQQYTDRAASSAFLKTAGYAAYLAEVEPLLEGPPQILSLTPMWIKGA